MPLGPGIGTPAVIGHGGRRGRALWRNDPAASAAGRGLARRETHPPGPGHTPRNRSACGEFHG